MKYTGNNQWLLTDSRATRVEYDEKTGRVVTVSVGAVSRATKVSYVGKHNWTITGDTNECSEGDSYTTLLKLTGCNPEGDFTCDDGQCIKMERRCDQVRDSHGS